MKMSSRKVENAKQEATKGRAELRLLTEMKKNETYYAVDIMFVPSILRHLINANLNKSIISLYLINIKHSPFR